MSCSQKHKTRKQGGMVKVFVTSCKVVDSSFKILRRVVDIAIEELGTVFDASFAREYASNALVGP